MFLACMFMMVGMAFAQKQITGTVIDAETGEPLIGVAVRVPGTTTGVLTDMDGKFSVALPSGQKNLTFSMMGMRQMEVAAKAGMVVNMESDTRVLNDVMVVAYGTATKASFTGSATVVGADQIEGIQTSNVLDALTGHVAGVELFNPSGNPASNSPSIRIRGISSISAGTSPLIVLDGTPYAGDMNTINPADIESMTILKDAAASALYGSRAANGVIVITTKKGKAGQDTKVSFDAKWGSNSRAQRTYKTVNSPAQYYELYYSALKNYAANEKGMGANDANLFANQNLTASNGYGLGVNVYNVPEGQLMIGTNGKLNPKATLGNVVNYNGQDYLLTSDDWMKEAYSNGLRQEYNLSIANATDKSNFYASVGYMNNEGITFNSDFESLTGRLKADLQAKPWLKVGANMNYNHYSAKSMLADGSSNSSENIFAAATQIAPIYPVYIRDGKGNVMYDNYGNKLYDWGDGKNAGTSRPYLAGSNAIQSQQLDLNQWEGNAFGASGTAEIRFLEDFKFTSINTVNLDESRSTSLTNPYFGNYATSNGIVGKGHNRSLTSTFVQQLDWGHQFGKHDVGVMVGHEYYDSRSYSLSASRSNMFDPSNLELDGAVTDGSSSSSTGRVNREGYQSRVLYNYAQRYFFSGSFRRDASSRFTSDGGRWWGNFWSAGGAWLMSDEQFMKEIKWVDMLKAKLSYGEIGNDNISNYLYTNRYSLTNGAGNPAVLPSSTRGNEDITWETVGELNAGIEFELFKSRLYGGIEYFWRKTSDMLYFFSTPISSGYSGYYDNVGDMVNHGIELELNADVIRSKDLNWTVGMNLTHYKNKITYMPDDKKTQTVTDINGKEYQGYASGNVFMGEGLSLGSYYMLEYAGIYTEKTWQNNMATNDNGKFVQETAYDPTKGGLPMWYVTTTDSEGKEVVRTTTDYSNATEYVCSEGLLPKIYGGFNTRLEYRGFDLSLDFSYQLGGKVVDSDYQSLVSSPSSDSRGSNFHADLLNAWTPENSGSQIPRLQYGDVNSNRLSTYFLTNANYLSLQNVNLGYTLPRTILQKAKIDNLRVYLSAQNVWLWSARQGLDPRTAATSLSYGSSNNNYYSLMRTISAGVSVTF